MATTQCPNCNTVIHQPTNVVGIVLGIIGLVCVGLPMLLIALLMLIGAIGAASGAANESFAEVEAKLKAVPVEETAEATFETAPVSLQIEAGNLVD